MRNPYCVRSALSGVARLEPEVPVDLIGNEGFWTFVASLARDKDDAIRRVELIAINLSFELKDPRQPRPNAIFRVFVDEFHALAGLFISHARIQMIKPNPTVTTANRVRVEIQGHGHGWQPVGVALELVANFNFDPAEMRR